MVTEVALRGQVKNEEAPRGSAASPVPSRGPQARTPACRGPGPGFAQPNTLVRRETEKARDLRAWERRAPLLTVSPVVKVPVLQRGRAVGDGDSAGEPNAWELSEGVSSHPPKEQASDLLSED